MGAKLIIRSDAMYWRQVARITWLMCAVVLVNLPCDAAKRRFTVADDIGLSHFGDPDGGEAAPITFSPDGRYFVVDTERGLMDENRPESTLRIYRVMDVNRFLLHPEDTREPAPVWKLSRSTYRNGPIITSIRWLPDSKGFAFLVKTKSGSDQLFVADLSTMMVRPLTLADQQVTAFSIRSANNFVYTVLSPAIREKALRESQGTSIVGTGRDLYSLLVPTDFSITTIYQDLSELWVVVNGKRRRVEDKSSGRPIPLHSEGRKVLALSPDGSSVVTALAVNTVPAEWETWYPPSMPSDPSRIRASRQDLEALEGHNFVSEYVSIDLSSGKVSSLTNAPMAENIGWSSSGEVAADWSSDGQSVALINTFLPPSAQTPDHQLNRPCIAVIDVTKRYVTCLERLKGEAKTKDGFEDGFRSIRSVRFGEGSDRLTVEYSIVDSRSNKWYQRMMSYVRSADGLWTGGTPLDERIAQDLTIDIGVKENMNEPPTLVGTNKANKVSRVILDPNPQLKDIDLGEVSVFKWKDNSGRDWTGGLYKPPDYVQKYRYPLVVQTHGFAENAYRPYGAYPSAFAARELAAVGILVLQAPDCPITMDPEEGPRCVMGYEAAVQQLVADGLADPDRVGIVGFSRTCYYVMEMLTTSKFRFRAASITDGLNYGYLQYMASVDLFGKLAEHYADAMFGVPPFGGGLQQWVKLSPEFNIDKVEAPLQVVAIGRLSLMSMWEPYAALRVLNRPVDLMVLPKGTHVLTNPGDRKVSQGGTVDWFLFWLKGDEDPDPIKAQQYARWRALRNRQGQRE